MSTVSLLRCRALRTRPIGIFNTPTLLSSSTLRCRTLHTSRLRLQQSPLPKTTGFPSNGTRTSTLQRLQPSFERRLHTSLLSRARDYFNQYPQQPKGFWSRLKFNVDKINGAYLVYGIIAVDVLVWAGFQVAQSALQLRDPKPLTWLYNNMTSSWDNLKSGRVWTLVTSAFAHQQSGHLFMNALGLYMFCPFVAQSIGSFAFLQVYLLGSIGCDLFSTWWNRNQKYYRSLGASGALCSIMSFTACLAPKTSVALYGIIPMPLWGVVVGLFLYDLYGAQRGGGHTDFAGHLGGTFTGIGLYFLRRRLGLGKLY